MLRKVPVTLLRPGVQLIGALRSESGECILPAGEVLTQSDVARIASLGVSHLYGGKDWPADFETRLAGTVRTNNVGSTIRNSGRFNTQQWDDLANSGDSISVEKFRKDLYESILSGICFPHDIFDDDGVLLLAAGVPITSRFLQLLRERGIEQLNLRSPQPQDSGDRAEESTSKRHSTDLATPESRRLDARLAGELAKQPPLTPAQVWRRPTLSVDELKIEAVQGLRRHASASAMIADVCQFMKKHEQDKKRMTDLDVRRSVSKFIEMAAYDFDLLPLIVSMQAPGSEYIYDHSVNVALLSVSMAYQLGFSQQQILDIGLGAMLQDIGMLRVPEATRLAPRPLTPEERFEIHRHPFHTLAMLEDIRGIPLSAKMIAYQVHERNDGTGYPHRRNERQIHQFAKIVAAADAYAAMTRPRPYRDAISPYEAAKTVLMFASQDKFDRTIIRAFLDTISLFPIGSSIELNTGQVGRVLRANPGMHTKPVIETVDAGGNLTGEIIDLSQTKSLKVVGIETSSPETIDSVMADLD